MARFYHQLSLLFCWLLLSLTVVQAKGFSVLFPATTTTTRGASRVPSTVRPTITALLPRGGGGAVSSSSKKTTMSSAADSSESKCPVSKSMAVFGAVWGSGGVVYILAKAIKRVLPIAIEPFKAGSSLVLTPFQWGCYALTCLFFAYAEGYKGFQLKFSPLVVKRSFSLVVGTPQASVFNYLLAPLYSMGLIHATRKRMIVSWSVTMGVALLVAGVKRLNPVWRCIMDAGVVVGLTWGSLSILSIFLNSWRIGKAPDVDACLPTRDDTAKKD